MVKHSSDHLLLRVRNFQNSLVLHTIAHAVDVILCEIQCILIEYIIGGIDWR